MNILPEIIRETDYLISVRRHLHKNPELSLKEYATSVYIEEQLEAMGIPYRKIGETGILGMISGSGGNGKTILLRADIDGLPIHEETGAPYRSRTPGIMHACGHDAHTASLLGAAKVLQTQRSTFSGKVLLVFQAAEEFGHGSKFFLEENVTAGVDRALGLHVAPEYPIGTLAMTRGADSASCDYFKITVQGREAHITRPWQGVDALYIASLIVTNLKSLVKDEVDPLETALIGVGKISSGTAYNIIAGDAVIEGTTRTFLFETQDLLKKRIIETAEQIAMDNGGRAIVEFETFTVPLINNDTAFDEVIPIAVQAVGSENVITDKEKVIRLGSDDFAEYLRITKGVYVHVGTANEINPNTKNPLHNSRFDIDEQALLLCTHLYVSYALTIIKEPSF
jgi:amidohydrolase